MTWFIRIIPMTSSCRRVSRPKPQDSREGPCGKSQSLMARACGPRQIVKANCEGRLCRQVVKAGRVDGTTTFVICSKIIRGGCKMTRTSKKTLLMAAALSGLATSAFAQAAAPTPWELKPDMGYAYDKEG